MKVEPQAESDENQTTDIVVSQRAASLALMFAEIHLGDGDCLGTAARELYIALSGSVKLPEDFDC